MTPHLAPWRLRGQDNPKRPIHDSRLTIPVPYCSRCCGVFVLFPDPPTRLVLTILPAWSNTTSITCPEVSLTCFTVWPAVFVVCLTTGRSSKRPSVFELSTLPVLSNVFSTILPVASSVC